VPFEIDSMQILDSVRYYKAEGNIFKYSEVSNKILDILKDCIPESFLQIFTLTDSTEIDNVSSLQTAKALFRKMFNGKGVFCTSTVLHSSHKEPQQIRNLRKLTKLGNCKGLIERIGGISGCDINSASFCDQIQVSLFNQVSDNFS
jgi:hypothetical protein